MVGNSSFFILLVSYKGIIYDPPSLRTLAKRPGQHAEENQPVHSLGSQVSYPLVGLSLTSIFFDSIIDILFFDSDYFDSILKNCTNRIFSHIPHYFCVSHNAQTIKVFSTLFD